MPSNGDKDLIDAYQIKCSFEADFTLSEDVVWQRDRTRGNRKIKVSHRWKRQEKLGSGGFGEVWLEVDGNSNTRAVKKIKKPSDDERSRVLRELVIMAMLSRNRQQPSFAEFYGWYVDNDHLYVAMEYFQHRDLYTYLEKHRCKPLPEKEVCSIMLQVAQGLETLHENDITHRDLKPENILVSEPGPDWFVKLGDFGMSKRATMQGTGLHTRYVTGWFDPPEVIHLGNEDFNTSYTPAVDVWHLGALVYYLLTLEKPPPIRCKYVGQTSTLQFEQPPAEMLHSSDDFKAFILNCLQLDPTSRPAIQDVLEANWLKRFMEKADVVAQTNDQAQDVAVQPAASALEDRRNIASIPVAPSEKIADHRSSKSQRHKPDNFDEFTIHSKTDAPKPAGNKAEAVQLRPGSPRNPSRSSTLHLRVCRAYKATSVGHLNLSLGTRVEYLSEHDGLWLRGHFDNKEGLLPRDCVVAPVFRKWAFEIEGYFIAYNNTGIRIKELEETEHVLAFSRLSIEDFRFLASWTRIPIISLIKDCIRNIDPEKINVDLKPLRLNSPGRNENAISTEANKSFTAQYGGEFTGYYKGFVKLKEAEEIKFIPVELMPVESLQLLQRYWNQLPEVQLQRMLAAAGDVDSSFSFGHTYQKWSYVDNVQPLLFHCISSKLLGFSFQHVYLSGRKAIQLAALEPGDVRVISESIRELVKRVERYQSQAVMRSVDDYLPVKTSLHSMMRNTLVHVVDLREDHIYLLIGGQSRIWRYSLKSMPSTTLFELYCGVFRAEKWTPNEFRCWETRGLILEVQERVCSCLDHWFDKKNAEAPIVKEMLATWTQLDEDKSPFLSLKEVSALAEGKLPLYRFATRGALWDIVTKELTSQILTLKRLKKEFAEEDVKKIQSWRGTKSASFYPQFEDPAKPTSRLGFRTQVRLFTDEFVQRYKSQKRSTDST